VAQGPSFQDEMYEVMEGGNSDGPPHVPYNVTTCKELSSLINKAIMGP
jgi:hypothetical protein